MAYIAQPDTQLNTWSADVANAFANYGAAYLFTSYVYEQYGAAADLAALIADGAGENTELLADLARRSNPAIDAFSDLYADWIVASVLDDATVADGRYAYTRLPTPIVPQPPPNADWTDSVAQFGSDVYAIAPSDGDRIISFDGSDTIGIAQAAPDGTAMWWSNRGDNAHSTLERVVDLGNVSSAMLQFRLWYAIESGYDYGFVSVSTDGGTRWETLPGRHTTTDDPQGTNYGHGWSGTSGGANDAAWVDEQIDLTPYAGQTIVLRFSLITDDGVSLPGLALDNLRIPEIGWSDDAERATPGWEARGWTRTDNRLPQQWEVRLIRRSGTQVAIEPLELDAINAGSYRLAPGESGTLVVMATTPHTTERASYRVTTEQP
jgi:immune inhibitor A